MPAEKAVKVETCFTCHSTIKELHTMGKHAKVNCTSCHSGLDKHQKAPGPETRPSTDKSWEACGQCHKEQYNSFMKETYHRPARDEKSQLTNRAPNPFWDKLMMGTDSQRTQSHKKPQLDAHRPPYSRQGIRRKVPG